MDATKWYASPRVVALGSWLLAILIVTEGVIAIGFRDGDFEWHRDLGNAFLAHSDATDHYLPARELIDVPLTFGPYRVTRAIAYVLCLVSLWISFRVWSRLANLDAPLARVAGFGAVLLLLPFLLRDLDECGMQLFLLFFLSVGGYALFRGASIQAGFWLATAAVYKCVPLLCLPWLLWKRQWRAAASMGVFLGLWCAAPALYSGWEHNLRAHQRWAAASARLKAAQQAYPSLLEREPQRIMNLSLYALIARNLETYPPGHPLYVDHPLFVQFGNLDAATAYQVQHGILLVIGLVYLWRIRTPLNAEQSPQTFAGEWASLCVLCALLAPLCWKQHLVLALPCAFLAIAGTLTAPRIAMLRLLLLGTLATPIYLNRQGIAGDFADVLLSFKIDTLAILALTIWSLLSRMTGNASPAVIPQRVSSLASISQRAAA